MALETLKGKTEIGGYKVANMADLAEKHPEFYEESGQMNWKWFEENIRPTHFVMVRPDVNSLTFTIQNGPIKENGVNGGQVDTLIHAAWEIIDGLNNKFPCKENKAALFHLDTALNCLEERTKRRDKQGIEGTNQEQGCENE